MILMNLTILTILQVFFLRSWTFPFLIQVNMVSQGRIVNLCDFMIWKAILATLDVYMIIILHFSVVSLNLIQI